MNNTFHLFLAALTAVCVLAACSKAPEATETTGTPPASPQPFTDPSLPEKTVEIHANDQMQFDVTAVEAKPGQKVTVTLKNAGTLPKVAMGHNFVLLANGVDPVKFLEAGRTQMANDYIAPEMKDKILAHTRLLGPGESETVTFVAPPAGIYTYLCAFPGHYAVGMKGTLTVQ